MIIRWICEKDSKKWIYPVEKCIYCKGPITKQISREAKVVGITKVNIPSPFHPVIPYNVLLLEDEHGNRVPKKTMKNYEIGDTYSIKKANSEGAVVIAKIKYDLKEILGEALNLLNSFDITKEDKVLIKPSIIEAAYPYQAVNTSPKVIDAILSILKEKGISDILVAEQAMLGNDTLASAQKAGILSICKKHDVRFLDLSKAEYVEKDLEGIKLKVAKEFIERKVINVPAMKTNSQIGISGAVENMIRVLDIDSQKKLFSEDIEKMLPRLVKALPKCLNIGDASLGMHGQGPTSLGEPAFINILLLSKDPVALDSVFSEMGMFDKPSYLEISDVSNNIEIVNDELEAIKFNMKPAKKEITAHPKIKLIDGKADPYVFNSALKLCSKLVGLLGYELYLAVGKHITEDMVSGKERIIAYGQDAIDRLNNLGVKVIVAIGDDVEEMEKLSLVKSILEDANKLNLSLKDKLKSKMANFSVKIKKAF